ncbi:MAG: T9SS type A sorting domain-containing protein [Candidatus Caldipriscus sp.]|nr:T9SS type A sorting domain-containing protein [Candidatus Caldipriscus sp.]
MIGVILSTAPVVQVHSYRITGRVSLREAVPDLKRVDVAESPSRGSGWVPFLFTEIYQDSAPNQYTHWGNSHRPLFRNGDSICLAFRRVESSPGTGRIGVAWSFNGGSTWNVRGNVNYDAGLADAGGRYPNCAGFNSAGEPVVAWPELKPGPAWGKNCVAVVKSSGPVGACQTVDPDYDSVYHNIAWRVSGDIYAVVGFTTNDAIVGFLFDASTGNKVPGSEVLLRDPNLAEDVSLFDLSIKGDTLYVVGSNSAEGDGIVKIYYDGSSLATDPVPPSAGGSSVVESHLVCCWTLSIGSNNFNALGYGAYSFTIDRFGRGWSVYALRDGAVLSGSNPGHIIVHHAWDDSSLVIFAPWTGSGVDISQPVYNPRVTVDETNANKRVVSWIQYDNNPAGCGGSNFDKSIFYAATSDGGATWGINSATNPTHRVDFHFPAIDRGADYTYSGDVLTVTYLKPRDGVTDLYCNLIANGTASSYVYVATDTVSYSSGSSEDTVIVSVNERGNLSIRGEAEIYDIRGSLVAKTKGDGILNLRKGIYFIKANGRVYKVIIR